MFDLKDEKCLDLLFKKVKEAQELSYSPYSNFRVGACIVTKDDRYILGANIENASYGLSLCAERNAMFRAHLEGVKKEDILVLGLVGDSSNFAYPCGACRQVMSEMLLLDCPVVIFSLEGKRIITSVKELLPYTFTKEDLK